MRRKLTLDVEELAVESFDTVTRGAGGRGTVHGHVDSNVATCANMGCGGGTQYTDCFGGCGVVSEGGGLSACCATADCTNDPQDARCFVSLRYCSEEEPCYYTIDHTCGCG